jgi:phosphatidylethanolamine-binding protein (PEBP) family uncharacterized protein
LGVIAVYRTLREEFPRLQLAMVGSMALDDPEGWNMYNEIMKEARTDPEIHVFTNIVGVGNVEVNAFQRLSQVIIQKSIREGLGLVVSEAMWKSTPVVAGRAGGIPLQMADGVAGVLIDSPEECASAVRSLLRDPDHARDLAHSGRERVQQQFLSWTDPPEGTKSFALIVEDPDAGAKQGVNDFHKIGYRGPCPPQGHTHRYVFTLYALDRMTGAAARSNKGTIVTCYTRAYFAEAQLIGTYAR